MATTWKKILTKTPIASDLATGATDSYVLTATGGDATAPAWEALPIVNTTYSIKAEDVTGGAELDLDAGGTGAGTDTIKFASAGATTVSSTDASTIKISSTNTQCGGDGHTKYAITDTFAADEVTQMQNIGATTISAAQWGYLGAATGAITNTDRDVDVDVLETRLGQIDTSITIGNSSSINTTIKGNLIVEGTTVTTKTETLSIADNTIVLNSDLDGGSVDAGFVVQMGTGSDNNPSLWFDTVQAGADDSTGRWVVGSTDDATATIGGYVADVMQVIINGEYTDSSTKVPIGHMQYDAGNLYVRVEG